MTTRRALMKEADIRRFIKVFEETGVGFAGMKIDPDGTVHMLPGAPKSAQTNSFDEIFRP